MRAMPFRVADDQAVIVEPPTAVCGGRLYTASDPVESWDYLSPLQIIANVRVNSELFRAQTGLTVPGELGGISVILQADCTSVGSRHLKKVPIDCALDTVGPLELDIPPGAVGKNIDVTVSVVLDRPDSAPRSDRTAHLRGSRLFVATETWRFGLEGAGGAFPTEAIDFGPLGLPVEAPWHLHVDPDLARPFMGAVRLRVNTQHPMSREILSGDSSLIASVLFHDILLQMLLSVADASSEDLMELREESLGEVLEGHCRTYMHQSLVTTVAQLSQRPAEFMTQLKAATGFAAEGAR